MKKISIIFVFVVIFSALWADFIIEQELIDSLKVSALKNIEPLPVEYREIYGKYLKKYPDGIMAFMISAEDNSKLIDTNPAFFVDNYKVVKKLMKMEDYEKFSDTFVLSYIIKTTVSHEKYTNYRKIFAQEKLLDYVKDNPDINDRIREINLWCRENLRFVSTSGRTQDPLSVLQKSNIGRCGEMQVFFISACRTIGIPARPAWTPWWAHTDNNHAWTEVFVDGKWHYVENAQPEYYLDSTWFSSSVTKALLVLARSSFPDSLDDVVIKGKNNSYVNSTSFYQETRKIDFRVLDVENSPIDSVGINFYAFNFSMLRPLLGVRADSLGMASINISKGGFLAIAAKDSLFDFAYIPYGEISLEHTFILEDKSWEDEDFVFEYIANSGTRKENPPAFKERKKKSEENYKELIKLIKAQKIPKYAPKEDSLFVEIFEKARNNKKVLLKFIKNNRDIESDFWSKMLQVDVKFLWQANLNQWQNIYEIYLELKASDVKEEQFSNLLSPSVKYEILPNKRVDKKYLLSDNLNSSDKISRIIEMLHADFIIDEKKATNGLLSLDNLLEAEYLQDFHFKTLSCYALKANHIPAQYTRIPSTIIVMADSVWQNYDVVENKFFSEQKKDLAGESSLIPIKFELVDESGLPVTINSDNISTTIFKSGRFYPNDRQLDYDKENSIISGDLEAGIYQVQIGIRESGDITKVKLLALELDNQDAIDRIITFKDFKRNWKDADKKYFDFITSFVKEKDKNQVILIGDYDNEPVQRLATKTRLKMENEIFVWIGGKQPLEPISNYIVSEKYTKFLEDYPELKHRLITFYYDFENDKWKVFEGNWDILGR